MLAPMNTPRHTKSPHHAAVPSRVGTVASLTGDRADLGGLEVRDSSWDEWVEVQLLVQQAYAEGMRPLASGAAQPVGAARRDSVQ